MSSVKIERKRRSDFDTSDSSSDELPAVKIRKLDSAISVGKKITEVCKNLLNWITPEFVRNMAVRVSQQRSSHSLRMEEDNCRNHPIDMEDDDDECAVIGVQNGTGACSRSTSTPKMDSNSISARPSICPLTIPSYLFDPENPYYKKASQTMERRNVNGFPVGTETGKEDVCRSRQSEKCIAPITNPRSEIDILLEKDKDVEIINEVYPAKNSSGPTRKIRLLSDTRATRCDLGDFVNSCSRSSYYTKSYTANEVVRLQEKAQYSLLLEKVVKRMPLFKPAFPKGGSQSSAIQVDLTEDDVSATSCPFKKEKVVENVTEFLKKYYKPCDLMSRTAKKESRPAHTQRALEREINKDDDDDIQIIEYPELPKLRPRKSSVTNGGFFSDAWIADMKMSMISDTEKMLQFISENEGKVQRLQKRREARIAEDMRKREEQRLAGFIFPEDVEMEEEVLPEITPEMNAIIETALAPGDEDDIICILMGREKNVMTRKDISTLNGFTWLNDQVINYYLCLIEHRSVLDGYPTIHCFNSFFYPKLKREGPSRMLLRWTRKLDILSKDLIYVPLHLEMHWAMLIIDNRNKTIKYYDSMDNAEKKCLKLVELFIKAEMLDKKKMVMEPNTYKLEIPPGIPKQMNGSDCGMFSLKYAEYISRNAPLTFSQENMPYFRRRMVYEIVTKQLL